MCTRFHLKILLSLFVQLFKDACVDDFLVFGSNININSKIAG